ncbi:MAG: hypothetical protein QW728_07670 [Thermoplasmata archaeon]
MCADWSLFGDSQTLCCIVGVLIFLVGLAALSQAMSRGYRRTYMSPVYGMGGFAHHHHSHSGFKIGGGGFKIGGGGFRGGGFRCACACACAGGGVR